MKIKKYIYISLLTLFLPKETVSLQTSDMGEKTVSVLVK